MKNIVFFGLVFGLLILSFKMFTRHNTPEGKYNNKGYGNKIDSLAVLIAKTEWANNYHGRTDLSWRCLCFALILSFCTSVTLTGSSPSPLIYTQNVIVIWILLRSFTYYSGHHCDKFSNYSIARNMNIIRKHLGIKKSRIILSSNTKKVKSNSDCWNFTYKKE